MMLQQALAAPVPFPPYDNVILTVAGMVIVAYNAWMARSIGKVRDIVRDTHHALCGNPEVDGDKGIAGRLRQQEERQEDMAERINTLEWHLHNTVAMKDHNHDP